MVLAALLAFAAMAGSTVRRIRGLQDDVAALSERVAELSARLETAEQDAAAALARADVAESVLLDKGVADEDDLEAARTRSAAEATGGARHRDGALH